MPEPKTRSTGLRGSISTAASETAAVMSESGMRVDGCLHSEPKPVLEYAQSVQVLCKSIPKSLLIFVRNSFKPPITFVWWFRCVGPIQIVLGHVERALKRTHQPVQRQCTNPCLRCRCRSFAQILSLRQNATLCFVNFVAFRTPANDVLRCVLTAFAL